MEESTTTIVQFGFSSSRSKTCLNLGASQRKQLLNQKQSPIMLNAVTFKSVRSVIAARQLAPARMMGNRVAPFASLSLAAISAAPAKGKDTKAPTPASKAPATKSKVRTTEVEFVKLPHLVGCPQDTQY